jgi:hypothetical protein
VWSRHSSFRFPQKEVAVVTLTLGSLLAKSSFHPTDVSLVAAAGQDDPSGVLSALIVCMLLVMALILRLFGGMLAPFKEVVKAAFAALGALLLTGVLLAMLVAALVMSA